ncbi:MAG: beta-N-acetylglucosaminidase domain-containing protein [Kosmotoga sp.]|uniref:protein O-GlcNAcase n=1 Tax=Kosmotoga sp. TaxID=1955248 RepID=UPI001DA20203|nr:protein O-GlcNAcase [Kosmotoga sp.]MBO8167298.1 beta-N-acetylglucosaminidase domain-containing protein [Kosmotoga sp.]
MAFEILGVVEGFYGKPWPMERREEIIKFIGEQGYNLYIYAPKDDELHRFRWREPYPEEFMRAFKRLVYLGEESGVAVSVAISPCLSVSYSSENDLSAIVNKYLGFAELGVGTFGLFYDDIPPALFDETDKKRFDTLAEAQAHFANRVIEKLRMEVKHLNFIVCPTEYHKNPNSSYLKELARKLDPDAKIMWTGPQVCSKAIPVSDAMAFEESTGRKALYWDNYPVNDSYMIPELHIGPYTGRSPELSDHSAGIVLNPMIQPEASKVALGCAAKFFSDPCNYIPEKAWKETIQELFGELSDAFEHFALYNMQSPLHPAESEKPTEVMESFKAAYINGDLEKALTILQNEGQAMLSGGEKLLNSLDDKLIREISPWLKDYITWGKLLLEAVEILESMDVLFDSTAENEKKVKRLQRTLEEVETQLKAQTPQNTLMSCSAYRDFVSELCTRTKGVFYLHNKDWQH